MTDHSDVVTYSGVSPYLLVLRFIFSFQHIDVPRLKSRKRRLFFQKIDSNLRMAKDIAASLSSS